MDVVYETDDKGKEKDIVVEMRSNLDLYYLSTTQFDFTNKGEKQTGGHSFYLSLSPEKAEELKQKLTGALKSKK